MDKNENVNFDLLLHNDEKNSLVAAFARKTELEGLHTSYISTLSICLSFSNMFELLNFIGRNGSSSNEYLKMLVRISSSF